MDKSQIKKDILLCFKRQKRPSEENLNLFVDDLVLGVQTDWWDSKIEPSKSALNNKKMTEQEIMRNIQELAYDDSGYYDSKRKLVDTYIATVANFQAIYKDTKDIFVNGPSRLEHYSNILKNDPLRMIVFGEVLEEIMVALNKDLHEIPQKKKGRRKYYGPYVLARHIFVMADCLLGAYGSKTNGNTLFNNILQECFFAAGYKVAECKHYIESCYNELSVVLSMEEKYKQYNRLDLFKRHVQKTNFQEDFLEDFNGSWSKWEKYQGLSSS